MTTYTDNTIFTEYAIKKINNNLLGNYEDFNFQKIKIGNKSGSFDYTRDSLTNNIYTLNVDSIEINNNVFTIYCTIPESIEGFDILEIGIFDTINGIDNLFTLTSVDTLKPSKLSYELVIIIDINLNTLNISNNYPTVEVNDPVRTSISNVSDVRYTLNYITTNLERNILHNSTEVGYNRAQVFYREQQDLEYYMQNLMNCNFYSTLISRIGSSNITDCFLNTIKENFSFYKIRNLVNYSQYIGVNNGLFNSSSDKITFSTVGGDSLFISANLDELSQGIILCKVLESEGKYFFSFKIEGVNLIFTLYSNSGYYSISYDISSEEIFIQNNKFNNFIITFNNNFSTPSLKMYINGVEVTVLESIVNFTELTSNNSIPLVNYTYSSEGVLNYNKDYSIKAIVGFNKVLSEDEIYLLNTLDIF